MNVYLLKDISTLIIIHNCIHNCEEEFVREGRRVSPGVSQNLILLISLPMRERHFQKQRERERDYSLEETYSSKQKEANIANKKKPTRRTSLQECHLTVTYYSDCCLFHTRWTV